MRQHHTLTIKFVFSVLLQETEVELQEELELPDGWEKHEGLPIIKLYFLDEDLKC